VGLLHVCRFVLLFGPGTKQSAKQDSTFDEL